MSGKNTDGKIAGLYDLEETIGKGHYAVVKLARHVFTGEKVAVKVIDKTKLDEVSKAHLFQEVRCMKLVQHPHVVKLYEVIDTATRLYLVLEWGDGGDMYDYIMKHDGGLDEVVARRYFGQIVQAIDYCHRLHVVHRDLKPENVVFFETSPEVGGIVKLTDFGFSNKFVPGRKLETSCGSLAYSAPEILLGDSYDAPAVDIWSLGVILYMLVCGEPPFQEANDSETLTMIMDCKYRIPEHISPLCRDIIGRMLVREPSQRATLSDIASHQWMLHEGQSVIGSQAGVTMPLVCRETLSDEDHCHIVQRIVDGKIASRDDVAGSLESSAYNHITATYYLLAERLLRKRAEAALAIDGATTGSGSSGSEIPPILSPLNLSPRMNLQFPSVDNVSLPVAVDALVSPPSIHVGPPPPSMPATSAPSSGLHTEINMLMCRCAMIHEDSLEVFDNEGDEDGGNVTTIDQSHSDSEVPDEADSFDSEHLGFGTLLEIPSVRGVTKLVPTTSRPLVSVRSSPQLLNEICEETESVDDEDEPQNAAAVPPHISRRHSTETPRHLDRLHRVHRRKLATMIPRVASCSSSDASDTDEVDQRKHHQRKHKTNAAIPTAACVQNLSRRDSSEHSSDNDNQPTGIGGASESTSARCTGLRCERSSQGNRDGYSGDRHGNGHMDSLHEHRMETGYCSDICVSTDIRDLDNKRYVSQHYSDYQLSNRRRFYKESSFVTDLENSRNQLSSFVRLRSGGDLGNLVEQLGPLSCGNGMKRWHSSGKFRSQSKLDMRRETHVVAAALLAKLGCTDVLRCSLRTRKVSL